MAAVIEPLMSGAGAPWLLYGIGAAIAILLTLFNVSALAFALGMFIPLELNLPLLVGGLINWYVTTRSNKEQTNNGKFSSSGMNMPDVYKRQVVSKSADDKLLERVLQIINGNISNPYLSVELIAREVGISRAHLHRKLKELRCV